VKGPTLAVRVQLRSGKESEYPKDGTIVTMVFSAQKDDWLQRLNRLLLLVEDEEDTIVVVQCNGVVDNSYLLVEMQDRGMLAKKYLALRFC
jgi:hypothetical protein